MPKCSECGKDDIRVIFRKNPAVVYECENGHLFGKKRTLGKKYMSKANGR